MENNKPIKKYRVSSIKATVWENETLKENGDPFKQISINIEKGYKDIKGEWQKTNSYNLSDLPKLKVLVDEVYKDCMVVKE
jgi:hypothetical protein